MFAQGRAAACPRNANYFVVKNGNQLSRFNDKRLKASRLRRALPSGSRAQARVSRPVLAALKILHL
jgi:hypothetical protein